MSLTSRTMKALELYYSYDEKDVRLFHDLEIHLGPLLKQGFITSWHRGSINPGEELAISIDYHLNRANIILLLISPDFLYSKQCLYEMKRAMERHEDRKAQVIPIILRPTAWKAAPFGILRVLPTNKKPVTEWNNRDKAFLDVVNGIQKIVEEMSGSSLEPTINPPELPQLSSHLSLEPESVTIPTEHEHPSLMPATLTLDITPQLVIPVPEPSIKDALLPGTIESTSAPVSSDSRGETLLPFIFNPFPNTKFRGLIGLKIILFITLILLFVLGSASLLYVRNINNQAETQLTAAIAQATTNARTETIAAKLYEEAVAAHGIMFGFDPQHTGFNQYEKVLNISNVPELVQAWTYLTRDSVTYSSPTVASDTVYIGSLDHSLYALDAHSGKKLWSFTTANMIVSSPAVANGIVYIGSYDHSLYTLDAHSGKKLWSFTTEGLIYSSPTVANGVLYIGSGDHQLYALDARTGRKLWSFITRARIYSSPAVANGVVYIGSYDHSLYALDVQSGRKLWSYTTGDLILSSPAVENGVVYIGSLDHSLYALDAHSGKKLWSFTTDNSVNSSPAIANGVVYIGSFDHSLYALDAHTGRKLWSYATGDSIGYSSPAVANGIVYIGSVDHKVYAFHLPETTL